MSMYKFVVGNSLSRSNEVTISGDRTIKDIFDEAGLEIGGATPRINGDPIMNIYDTIDSLGLNPNGKYRVMAAVKAENAASGEVVGSAFVVTTGLAMKDIATLQKYKPEALATYDEKGNVEFVLGVGSDDLGFWGATVNKSFTNDGKATITINLPDMKQEEAKAYVIENYGQALLKLNALEDSIQSSGVLDEVAKMVEKIESSIVVKPE